MDSLGLAETISRIAGEPGCTARILLEVNIDVEPTKHGFRPEELAELWPQLTALPSLEIRGLMCIPAPAPRPDAEKD